MIVVDFRDYIPSNPDHPWLEARVRQAPSPDMLDLLAGYDEIDALPYNPAGTYRTEKATLVAGWYQLVLVDATGDELPFRPFPMWAPSVQDVADLCPAHTRVPIELGGGTRPTFTEHSEPTAAQVQGFVAASVEEVNARAATTITSREADAARRAAAWHAALLVETEFSHGTDDADTAIRNKQTSFLRNLEELNGQARRIVPLRLV